jgi:hypothetical protein
MLGTLVAHHLPPRDARRVVNMSSTLGNGSLNRGG